MNTDTKTRLSLDRYSVHQGKPLSRLRPSVLQSSLGVLCSELVLCRGLPGSGKTSIAKVLTMIGYRHFEADMYFDVDGNYQYDASRIQAAHDWCKRKTSEALGRGENVVVSNTFTRLVEMAPYYEMGANTVKVIEATGLWENSHGVPADMVERMAARWESLPIAKRAMHGTSGGSIREGGRA